MEANFAGTTFNDAVDFTRSKFSDKSYFSDEFKGITSFNYATFEKPNETRFEVEDMSMVSFLNTDITKIRFSDNIRWRGKDKFQIIEETWLEENAEENIRERRK